jgi:hypothetical protein
MKFLGKGIRIIVSIESIRETQVFVSGTPCGLSDPYA